MSTAAQPADLVGTRAFPAEAETEYEQSELTIPLVVDGDLKEILRLVSLLRMERGVPIINASGFRQFEFTIAEWECGGYSEYLGQWVTITLSEGPQPRSVCVSKRTDQDYPAMIIYNAIFDVHVGNVLVGDRVTGLGVGPEIEQIPPRAHVHFQKAFEIGPAMAVAGSCTTMQTITQEDYEHRSAEFRSLRDAG